MDFHHILGGSPSSSTSSSSHPHPQNGVASRSLSTNSNTNTNSNTITTTTTNNNSSDPMHSWWESISKARTRIQLLSSLLPPSLSSLSSLADSDRPARSLLLSPAAYAAMSSSLTDPASGSGEDPLCHWLYDTFLSSDPDLRLVVLSFVPLITSLYLSRIHSSSAASLSGFEAVLLALYSSEVKSRGGKAVVVNIPDLNQPSLYHTPKAVVGSGKSNTSSGVNDQSKASVGVICAPLEPQTAVKSTKRASIVGVALDCYYKQISQMPSWSKLEFCRFAAYCGGQECPCNNEFDEVTGFGRDDDGGGFSGELKGNEIVSVTEGMENLEIQEGSEDLKQKGVRIPLPWELFQPILRILGHCLLGPLISEDVKEAASVAVRRMYARASHELNPQAILATRSLIRLDKRSREAAQAAAVVSASSNANTPSKAKKPEILLVSK